MTGNVNNNIFNPLNLFINRNLPPIVKAYASFPEFKSLHTKCLKNRLSRMGHTLEFDPTTNEPILLINNEKKKWSEIKTAILASNDEKNTPTFESIPQGWIYNEQGFIRRNAVKAKNLDPDWTDRSIDAIAGKYFVEVVSENNGLAQHCWVRLIDENKKVISVGLGGKFKSHLPLRKGRSFIISPDPKEFTDHFHKSVTTRIIIDKSDYQKIKSKIESDRENIGSRPFQYAQYNCSVYACEILKEIGLSIENKEFITQSLGRSVSNTLQIKTPLCVVKALNYIAQLFRILLSPILIPATLFLGNFTTDAEQKKIAKKLDKGPKQKRTFKQIMTSLKDFTIKYIKGDLLKFNTGSKLTSWQRAVEKIRAYEVEKLSQEFMKVKQSDLTPELKASFEERLLEAKYGISALSNIKSTPLNFEAPKP